MANNGAALGQSFFYNLIEAALTDVLSILEICIARLGRYPSAPYRPHWILCLGVILVPNPSSLPDDGSKGKRWNQLCR